MNWKNLTVMIIGLMGFILFAGCDEREDILLDETEIEGPVKVRVVREVQSSGPDNHTFEVWDGAGNLRVFIRITGDTLPEGTMIVHDDRKIWMIKTGKQGYFSSEQVFSEKKKNLDSHNNLDE